MDDAAAGKAWRWFLPALLCSTALLKLFFAWRFPAFLTGDDLEVIETAAKYAVGLDYQPWVIRSLFHPLLLAYPAVKAGALLGLADARWITFFAALPDVLFSTAGILLLNRLARDLGCSPAAARAASFLYAFHWLPLAYGSTPYPRPISSVLLLGGFLLVERSRGGGKCAALAGALVACAFAVRWSEGLMLAPLAAFAWWRTRRAAALAAMAGGFLGGTLLAVGLFDALTWGAPFASLIEIARSLPDPNYGGFHPRPWYWYGWSAFRWLGPVFPLLILAAWRDRRARLALAIALCAVTLFSLSPLKELRYLQICIPFLALAAALGWERLHGAPGWRRALAALALVAAAAWGLERTLTLLRGKSQSAVDSAQFLRGLVPPVRTVVLEQMWAFGEKLYLGNSVAIRDLYPTRPLPLSPVEAALDGADAVALYERDVSPDLARVLAGRGFAPCARFQANASLAVAVYLPPDRPCR
jgi:hypothetical protein